MPSSLPLLHVVIRNREKVLVENDVKALSSVNEKGTFDILQAHANFISIITKYIKLYKPDNTIQDVPISQGVLKMDDNQIHIFLGLLPVAEQKHLKAKPLN